MILPPRCRAHRDGRFAVHAPGQGVGGYDWRVMGGNGFSLASDTEVTEDGWVEVVGLVDDHEGRAEIAHASLRIACCPLDADTIGDMLDAINYARGELRRGR